MVAGLFLMVRVLSYFVEILLASRRLPPKAAIIFSVWSSFLLGDKKAAALIFKA
ncbi:hypothetical protein HMPREF9436_02649, partial [Faecalibacterium cf. prausnitzii KLE1255]